MDAEDYRRTSHEAWQAVAPGWERCRSHIEKSTAAVGEWMIRELAPRRGDTVLELAAGPGDTGFKAAGIIGEGGRLISTDFSHEMVDVARRRSAQLELRNVEHRVMDAERIELDDNSVDGVLCRFGYMLMADPDAALSETRRVLRPGGRLVLAAWGSPDGNPWIAIGVRTLIERGHMPPPDPRLPGPFSMSNGQHTRTRLENAGFTTIRTEEVPVRFVFRDINDFINFGTETAGQFAMVIRGLSENERESIKRHLEKAFAGFASDGGYQFPGVALATVAS